MSPFRSRPTCVACNRDLAGAAARCPWCKTPILTMTVRNVCATVHGRRLAFALFLI